LEQIEKALQKEVKLAHSRHRRTILRKVHKTGLQVDDEFKALMREAATNTAGIEGEELLRKMVALVLK